jgi:peptide/nickel transport system substrate-binding protein
MTNQRWQFSLAILALFTVTGCLPPEVEPVADQGKSKGGETATAQGENSTNTTTEDEPGTEEASSGTNTSDKPPVVVEEGPQIDPNAPFELGNMIAPFTPPTLAEVDAVAEWIDRPVVDSMELLREAQAKEKPLVSVAEALKLRNDSKEANEKILSALGRLPTQDAEVNLDGEINRHAYGDVNSTNPILISSTVEFDVQSLIGFGLFSFDWKMQPFAAADSVKTWQTSKDGLMDKIVMRDDLTWSDGQPITAHDIVWSFKAIMTSKVPVPAVRSGTDKLKWIEAYDDYTLVYFHKEALPVNVWNLNFPVIPKHIYEDSIAEDPLLVNIDKHVQLENKPVSGGPYVIESRTRGQEILLKRRESYYMHNGKQVRDKPHFATIRFRIRPDLSVSLLALKSGDIDEMQLAPEQWTTQTTDDAFYQYNTKVFGLEWTEFHFTWNCKSPLFSDRNVRKAMSYAVDYEELLRVLRYGLDEQCNGPFHPTSPWAAKTPPPLFVQDLDKAEELLEAAGWTDSDGDGVRDKLINGKRVPFEFTLLTVNKSDRINICTLMKESLDQIQIKCNVKPLEFPVVIDKLKKHDFQAAFGGWGTGTDPYTLENVFKTNEERNYGEYSNPEVDRLFAQGMQEFDPEKRAAIYGKLHLLLFEDQPYTWLFYQNAYYGFNKSLRGYKFSPRGPYNYGPGFSGLWKPASL